MLPALTFLGARLVLLCIALSYTTRGQESPFEGDVMWTSPGWPPFIVSSLPFWVALPLLLGLAAVVIWRPRGLSHAYRSGFVAFYLGMSGAWSILFSLSFWETPEWPRDSLVPGLIELVACVVVAVVGLTRLIGALAERRRSRSRRPVALNADMNRGEGP
jgi:tryptophan-rich sensory protein